LQPIAVYCSFWAGLPSRLAARDATDNGFLMGKNGTGWDVFEGPQSHLAIGLMAEEKSMGAGDTAHCAAGRSCCRSTSPLLQGAQSAQSRSREGRDHPAALAGVEPATAGEPPERRPRTWGRRLPGSDPSHPKLLPADEPCRGLGRLFVLSRWRTFRSAQRACINSAHLRILRFLA
jgi:hypothetical protein